MARQLKVFSTPAGFVNAVVAARSQKAALEAWGVRENLFANGRASVVINPELIAQALKTPGEIVRVPIGSQAEILKGAKPPPRGASASPAPAKVKTAESLQRAERSPPPPPPPPPPHRSALTAAEKALENATKMKGAELERLDQELSNLQERRHEREAALDQAIATARSARDKAAKAYRTAGGHDA